jgi:hypothetical protein
MSRKLKEPKDIYIEKEVISENPIPEENVLSLRKKEWVIRIDPKQIKDFLYLHKHTLIFIFTFFTACAFIISTSSTNASVATFYPGTCLGGWQNVENATGEPNVEDPERIESFTKENSAVFENSNEEIFCGDFKGLIPEDSDPKKFTLAFHWSFDYGEIIHDDPLDTDQEIEIKEEDIANEEIQDENINNDNSSEKEPEIIEEILETNGEIIEEDSQKPQTEESVKPAEETTSLLRKIFSIAHAQEEAATETTTDPEPEIEEVSEPEPQVDVAPEQVSEEVSVPESVVEDNVENNQSIEENNEIDVEQNNEAENSSTGSTNQSENEEETSNYNVNTEDESVIEPSVNDIFEVVYTLDGENWDVLGVVRKDKWQDATFEIPYEKITSWEDLSKLQVRLKVLPSFDSMPIVYLDAISLSVEYVDLNMQIETIDFKNIVHTVESPEMFVFMAEKEGKYGIWVLDKNVIGKPEENLRKLETVGVLPYEPIVKNGIIFWLVGDPQTVAEEVVENIVSESVDEFLNSDLEQQGEDVEINETLDQENQQSDTPPVELAEEESVENIDLPIDTIDALENNLAPEEDGVTEVLQGQIPTAIVGFREDIGYVSQTILDTTNKDNWLNFEEYAIAWKDGAFLVFDKINDVLIPTDSIFVNKNTPNAIPKTYREWILNIPDFEKDEKELEVIDSENDTFVDEEIDNKNSSTEEVGGLPGENSPEEVEEGEIEVINVDEPKEESISEEKEIEVIEEGNSELSI